MPLDMYMNQDNFREPLNRDFNNNFIKLLNELIKILRLFVNNKKKKLNLTKLAQFFKIDDSYLSILLDFILKLQNLFKNEFKEFDLRKKLINNNIYFILESKTKQKDLKSKTSTETKNLQFLTITAEDARTFNDIIFVFQFIKRGKPFNLSLENGDFLEKVKRLFEKYPMLFIKKDDLLYISNLGLELGLNIHSYIKINKRPENFKIKNYKIIVE